MLGLRGGCGRKLQQTLSQPSISFQQCSRYLSHETQLPVSLNSRKSQRPLRNSLSFRPYSSGSAVKTPLTSQSATSSSNLHRKHSNTLLLSLIAVAVLTTATVTLTDSGKYGFDTLIRSTRVVKTTYVNIRDYQRTMTYWEKSSPEEYAQLLKDCHKRCALRTLRAMEKNGSIFIKLGQHLSSLNYLLPSEWCDTFIPLQDKCPVTSFVEVKQLVEKDTSMAFADVFSEFEEEPLGAASLAQVHRAIDRASGELVAVKVQHPSLDHFAPVDVALTSWTFRMLKKAFPDYDLTWLSDEMEVSLPQELDFELEGKNAERTRSYFAQFPQIPLVIPRVIWARRRILVMEYVTGARPDDLEFLDSHRISRDEVSAALARIFNTMIFAPQAPLHCDPHGGNIAILHDAGHRPPHNFKVILYDHGLYRTIPLELQRSYAKLWLAVLDANESRMKKYAYEVAGITEEQFPLFASAITGRDYAAVTQNVSKTPRTREEYEHITNALYGGGSATPRDTNGSDSQVDGKNKNSTESANGTVPSKAESGGGGMLQQLVHLLGQVPRIILLILKTNDLTRSLDTNLHTTQGPMRSFLILAKYAARTVYDEQLEELKLFNDKSSSVENGRATSSGQWGWWKVWPPGNAVKFMRAWTRYMRMEVKLGVYEWLLWLRGMVGLDNSLNLS